MAGLADNLSEIDSILNDDENAKNMLNGFSEAKVLINECYALQRHSY